MSSSTRRAPPCPARPPSTSSRTCGSAPASPAQPTWRPATSLARTASCGAATTRTTRAPVPTPARHCGRSCTTSPRTSSARSSATNAAKLYGFDMDALAPLAAQYGPTVEEVRVPLDELPDEAEQRVAAGTRRPRRRLSAAGGRFAGPHAVPGRPPRADHPRRDRAARGAGVRAHPDPPCRRRRVGRARHPLPVLPLQGAALRRGPPDVERVVRDAGAAAEPPWGDRCRPVAGGTAADGSGL